MKIGTGTAYYPEMWTADRVRYDAELMQKAGIRFVRMAEFAWCRMEPEEGVFDFKWLHEAVDIFGAYGIKSVLCTPSAAAPAWMCKKYPEILRMERNGTRAYFGKRDHTCYSSDKYRSFVVRIAEKMAESFKDDPNVYAWQIDNEPGCSGFTDCFCPDCQRKFREYIRNKFKTLDNLNECWKTVFWSGEYTDWDELELDARYDGGSGTCRQVESIAFRGDQLVEFIAVQADAVRKFMPNTKITTNMPTLCDKKKMADKLDFVADDRYHKYAFSNLPYFRLLTDHYRSLKPGVSPWTMETQVFPGWPRHDLSKYYYWQYIGHGMDHIFFFHWNNHLSGDEKLNYAVIGPTGIPGRKYETLKNMILESDKVLEKYNPLPLPEAKSAFVFDYFANWVYAASVFDRMIFQWVGYIRGLESLRRNGEAVDVLTPDSDFSKYKLLVFHIQPIITQELAEKIKTFVANGGVLVMNGRSGMFDQYGKNSTKPGPEYLHDLFGFVMGENMEIDIQATTPMPQDLPTFEKTPEFEFKNTLIHGKLDGEEVEGTLQLWCAELNVKDADVLLTYKNSALQGLPFLTQKKYGKGYAIYYAADGVDAGLQGKILKHAQKLAGISTYSYPKGVDVSKRGDLMIFANENPEEIRFPSPVSGTNVVGNALQGSELVLPPYSASVLCVK